MRHFFKLITLSCLLASSSTYAAYEVFLDPLYWRATETFDWVHSNNLNSKNLVIGFKAVNFNYDPGFRVGVGYVSNWDTKLYYTQFHTSASDSMTGNLTTGFLGGRLSQTTPTTFYHTGQAKYYINFNMLDWDLGKRFNVTNSLMLHPLIGLEGGTINQTFNTQFQNPSVSISEHVINNFIGMGPKVGIETNLVFLRAHDFDYSLIANLETSYLWGRWNFSDRTKASNAFNYSVNVSNRNFGSVGMQALLGASVTHQNFSMKLGYEISDWFNQCQLFNDETGTQNSDLVLQGLTLSFSYQM